VTNFLYNRRHHNNRSTTMPFSLVARSARLPLAALVLAAAAPAFAQGVTKCVVNGKTVYQSGPCTEGGGSSVKVDAGPKAEDAQAAQRRAMQDKAQAGMIDADRAASKAAANTSAYTAPAPSAANCAALNQRYAEAWGRRNAYIRSGSTGGTDRTMQDIESAKANVLRAGCKLE
jgi:hypothetical protein